MSKTQQLARWRGASQAKHSRQFACGLLSQAVPKLCGCSICCRNAALQHNYHCVVHVAAVNCQQQVVLVSILPAVIALQPEDGADS
jgi:hypothetical protein